MDAVGCFISKKRTLRHKTVCYRAGGRVGAGGRAAADGPLGRAVRGAGGAPGQRGGRVQQGTIWSDRKLHSVVQLLIEALCTLLAARQVSVEDVFNEVGAPVQALQGNMPSSAC